MAGIKTTAVRTTLALALVSAVLMTVEAPAVEIAFSGNGNPATFSNGTDGIGDMWQIHNASLGIDSNFAMGNSTAGTPPFNPAHHSNGLGTFATSFQLAVNTPDAGTGFKGIPVSAPPGGVANHFTVKPDVADPDTWITWGIAYNLLDSISGLFHQIHFTAPFGTRLDAGTYFDASDIAGTYTAGAGWAASFDDHAQASLGPTAAAEPASLALLGIGLVGLGAVVRRKRS